MVLIGDRIGSQLIDDDRQGSTVFRRRDRATAIMSCRSDLAASGDIAAATALECLDYDHAAVAAGTGMGECLRRIVVGTVGITGLTLLDRRIEQLVRSRDVLDASAVGEQTVVTDAVETVGQNVDEEAADELVDGERHHLGPGQARWRGNPST
jgi:hypothetical protein